MQKLFFPAWAVVLAGGVLLGAGLLAYLQHPGASRATEAPLPPRQERALRTRADAELQQVAAATRRAAHAAEQGHRHYAAGQVATRQAQALHRLTHPHASAAPRPTTDSAAWRLQRLLTTY